MKSINKISALSILLLLNLSFSSYSQDFDEMINDTSSFYHIYLKNGNKLIGKVEEKANKAISFNDIYIGNITVLFMNIKTVIKEDNTSLFVIKTRTNNEYAGYITKRESDKIWLATRNLGTITLKQADIDKISRINAENINIVGEYWFPNPHSSRYFFAPSAINLKKGEGYYHNAYILSNTANYGLTDNFTIGGGIILPYIFYITPKVGYEVAENIHLGAGLLFATTSMDPISAGIMYGLATYGSNDHNLTLGVGYGFISKEVMNKPIITINGMTRLGKKLALVTENWFIPIRDDYYDRNENPIFTSVGVYTIGFRFMGEKYAFDLALAGLKESNLTDAFFGIPYIDFTYKF